MEIKINTNTSIEADERMVAYLKEEIGNALSIFNDKLTRVEVHLADENGPKADVDSIICKLEARPRGLQPVMVSSKESTMHKAVVSASSKLKSALQTKFGKLSNH